MIQPILHSLYPCVYSCIIGGMKAIANVTDKCFGHGQVHMCTVPSTCSISYHRANIQCSKRFKHFLLNIRFGKPIRMPHFKKELKIFWKGFQKVEQFIFPFRRERITNLNENWSKMFFESHNAPEVFIDNKVLPFQASPMSYALVHFRAENKVFPLCLRRPFADPGLAVNLIMRRIQFN